MAKQEQSFLRTERANISTSFFAERVYQGCKYACNGDGSRGHFFYGHVPEPIVEHVLHHVNAFVGVFPSQQVAFPVGLKHPG